MSVINVRESIAKVIENPWRFVRILSLAIFFRLRERPLSIKTIISKCNQPGFVLRSAFLEIDMMQGTAFPPDEISFESKIHTLQDIFLQAGIILDVRLDDNNIPDLSIDGNYSDAELDGLRVAHRNLNFQETGNKWSAYLVVVTQNANGDLGILFTDDRRGSAVFHNETLINTDNLAFFRTVVHELGHQFNLHHDDGTTYNEGGNIKYSIMNQTVTIQNSSSGWPTGVGLTFRQHERKHLSIHEIANVKPGGPWKKCNKEHKSWHDDITV